MSERFAFNLALKHLGRNFPEIAWITGVAILLFSPISIIGNGLVLGSILLDPLKNLRTSPSSSLIFNLALADFLAAAFAGPLFASWLIYYGIHNSQPFSAKILPTTGIVSVGVSLFILVALTVDRQIAITTPLQYACLVTKKRMQIINVLIWCYFIILGTLSMVVDAVNSFFDISAAAHVLIASAILAVFNVVVICSVRIQTSNIKRTVGTENIVVLRNAFHREKAVTKTICVMAAVFEICLWPSIIISFLVYAMQEVTDLNSIEIILWVFFMSKMLTFANSVMNPFLYAWRLPKYRKTFQHFLIQLTKTCSTSDEQHQANTPLRLSVTKDSQIIPVSFSLPSLAHHSSNTAITSSITEQTVCSSAFKYGYTGEDYQNTSL